MTALLNRYSLRTRLTLLFVGAVFLLLLLYGTGVVVFVWKSLSAELDQHLQSDFDVATSMITINDNGKISLQKSTDTVDQKIAGMILAEVWTQTSSPLHSNDVAAHLSQLVSNHGFGTTATATLKLPNGLKMRYYEAPFQLSGTVVMVRVFHSEEYLHQTVQKLILIKLLTFPIGLILAYISGITLASRLLAPVASMADHAEAITAEHLDERLPVELPNDDVGRLAIVFNQTLARLEHSFSELRQFTSDASHELRTPLTCIRSVGEVALREDRDKESYREAIGSMLEESDRLAQLVDTLLTLSRSDGHPMRLPREIISLKDISKKVADDLSVLAEEKNQSFTIEVLADVKVRAVREVLCLAFVNLIDNAIKYSSDGQPIRIIIEKHNHFASVKIIDRGCGIPAEMVERVFDRFFRVDKGRSKNVGGHGLGLVIARWAVELNGGTLELVSEEGIGSEFEILLPLYS